MKKYVEIEMHLIAFAAQDVVTFSTGGFPGEEDDLAPSTQQAAGDF